MGRQTHQELLVVTLSDLVVQIQQNFMKSLLGAGTELGAFLCAVYFPQWQSKTGWGTLASAFQPQPPSVPSQSHP